MEIAIATRSNELVSLRISRRVKRHILLNIVFPKEREFSEDIFHRVILFYCIFIFLIHLNIVNQLNNNIK